MNWDNPSGSILGQMKFFDAQGKAIPTPGAISSSSMDNGVRQTSEFDLVFPKSTTVAAPIRLTVMGNKPVTVDLPFRFKNVVLP
jgi:hypothetical protein